MDYQDYFAPYAFKVNGFLDAFFKEEISSSGKILPLAADFWQKFQILNEGGKRVRANLVKLGYECFKKVDEEKILPISAAIEIVHTSLLVHDDIIDQSNFRHHKQTVHKQYELYHQKNYRKGDFVKYGENMGIVAGILGNFRSIGLVCESSFPSDLKIKAINEMCRFLTETGYGQGLDIDLPFWEKIKENDVLKVHFLKTAQYTFIGPLKIGGILAGAKEQDLKNFSKYGEKVGIAFQLQDDILGMFGTEKKTGKPITDDIKEGKNTLLYTYVLENGTIEQKEKIQSVWGKKEITLEELEGARKIIKESGSLDYSKEKLLLLIEDAKKIVPQLTTDKKLQEVFVSLADFIIQREK